MAEPSVVKYTCAADGHSDCPCYTSEKARPPPSVAKPIASLPVAIAPGESKWLCTCGQSKNFPYCDGSHKAYNEASGTAFAPYQLTNTEAEEKTFYLCTCGHSKKRTESGIPLCDGSHKKLTQQ